MSHNNAMETSYFDIPAFDANSQTSSLVVDLNPGETRMINYILKTGRFPFQSTEGVVRWCVAWGLNTLFGPLPSASALAEAKLNVLGHDQFLRQETCLVESVQKYLAVGEKENARRIVAIAAQDYAKITNKYFRELWMLTLDPAIAMLQKHGVIFNPSSRVQMPARMDL